MATDEKTLARSRAWKERNREQQREYQREYRRRDPEKWAVYRKKYSDEKAEFINSFKDRPCEDCGVEYPRYMMDFHHINRNKTRKVSSMWTYSEERIRKELAKCVVVCANCHRRRDYEEQNV